MTPEQIAALLTSVGISAGTFRQRLATTSKQAQSLYGAVLRRFAAVGTPPPLPTAAEAAALSLEQAEAALAELTAAEVIALDAAGKVAGVFPLSALPTRHQVQVAERPVLHAMCAVDALGIPAMLGGSGVVTSSDPITDQVITVHVGSDGSLLADPSDAVVLLATAGGGSIASACCPVIDFYASDNLAQQILRTAGLQGEVLSLAEAHALGVALFADLPAR